MRPSSSVGTSRAEETSLWQEIHAKNPAITEENYKHSLGYLKMIQKFHDARNKQGYQVAQLVTEFHDEELWLGLGEPSWNAFLRSERTPFPRSSAYRYVAVGQFMTKLDVNGTDFEDAFYDELGTERLIQVDDDGNYDDDATREANKVINRVSFMNMAKIAGLYNNDHISAAKSRELMAKSIMLNEDDFKLECKVESGGDGRDPYGSLVDEGLLGAHVVIRAIDLNSSTNSKAAAERLRRLADQIEEGEFDTSEIAAETEDMIDIAKRQTRYVKRNDQIFGIIK